MRRQQTHRIIPQRAPGLFVRGTHALQSSDQGSQCYDLKSGHGRSKLEVVLCSAPTGRAPAPAAEKAADGGDTTALWAALQMVLMLENVEYRRK